MHLRWELYPVPHEPRLRAAHGGSYFEESEWWKRRSNHHHLGSLYAMLREIFLFECLWRCNRRMWWRSLLMHAGLYCLAVACVSYGLSEVAVRWAVRLRDVAQGVGWIGLLLVPAGAGLLLWDRCTREDLKNSTHPMHCLQLVFLMVTSLLWITAAATGAAVQHAAIRLLSLDRTLRLSPMMQAGILLGCVLLAYVPYSPMAHFIGKYFSYHHVRWDDAPTRDGGLDSSIQLNLELQPTWSASHLGCDGRKTWARIAHEGPNVRGPR